MRRRRLVALLGGAAAALPLAARAQVADRMYRIGLLSAGAPWLDNNPNTVAISHDLAPYGYVFGKNLAFEHRGADLHVDQLPRLVAELAASKVDVIITTGYPAAAAANAATTLPVVAVNAGDPVATKLVASLARPGGHLTGISDVSAELTPKRLELLKQFAPSLRKVALLFNADDLGMTLRYRAAEAGARALGLSVQALGVREPDDFTEAFAAMTHDPPDALLMVTDALTILNRKLVFAFAAAHRLPAMYEFDFLVHEGALMSYGPADSDSLDRVVALVNQILKGAKPAELPFEQPTRFEFAINVTTAKTLGFEVPPSVLARADDVVE